MRALDATPCTGGVLVDGMHLQPQSLARPDDMPGCITVDLAAQTIEPKLELDKRTHMDTKKGKQFLKFVTWSTHPPSHPSHSRTVTLTNSSYAMLTFNLETTSPSFSISSARSSAPKHPLHKVTSWCAGGLRFHWFAGFRVLTEPYRAVCHPTA